METHYQYRAELDPERLVDVLVTLQQYSVPGVLELTQPARMRRVFVAERHALHVTSTDPSESLGRFLVDQGLLRREDLVATLRERSSGREPTDSRYAAELVKKGLVSPVNARTALRQKSESLLRDLFTWEEGQLSFRVGSYVVPTLGRISMPLRTAIKEGCKHLDPTLCVRVLGGLETVLSADWRGEDVIDAGLTSDELQLLESFDGQKSLKDISARGSELPERTLQLAFAFSRLRFLHRLPGSSPDAAK